MTQTEEQEIKHRCVAHLYALFNNDLKVQVSDTTKMSIEQKAKYIKLITYNL